MSSSRKIGRWKRFEIAFAEENRRLKSPFAQSAGPTDDKISGLGKTGKESTKKSAAVETASSEHEASPETAPPRRERSPVAKTPSLWEEARRQRQDAAKKRDNRR